MNVVGGGTEKVTERRISIVSQNEVVNAGDLSLHSSINLDNRQEPPIQINDDNSPERNTTNL